MKSNIVIALCYGQGDYKMSESEKVRGPAAYITNAQLARVSYMIIFLDILHSGMRILDDPMMYMYKFTYKQKHT